MTPASVVVFHAFQADRALLGRVLAAAKVDVRPEPPDASYLHDLAAAFYAGLIKVIERATERLSLPQWLLAVVTAVLAAAALTLLARAFWGHRARRRRAGGSGLVVPAAAEETVPGGGRNRDTDLWDAAAWRVELERRLAEERLPEALRAAWWWLARSLAGTRAEPTWTGRELLRWSHRDDLRELVRQLDRLAYGPRPPVAEEVRRLASLLDTALA